MFWSSWFRGDCDLPADPAAQVTWREGTVGPPAGDRGTRLSAEPEPDRAASGLSDGTAGSPRSRHGPIAYAPESLALRPGIATSGSVPAWSRPSVSSSRAPRRLSTSVSTALGPAS